MKLGWVEKKQKHDSPKHDQYIEAIKKERLLEIEEHWVQTDRMIHDK